MKQPISSHLRTNKVERNHNLTLAIIEAIQTNVFKNVDANLKTMLDLEDWKKSAQETVKVDRVALPQILGQLGYVCSDIDGLVKGKVAPDDCIHFHSGRGSNDSGFAIESKEYSSNYEKAYNNIIEKVNKSTPATGLGGYWKTDTKKEGVLKRQLEMLDTMLDRENCPFIIINLERGLEFCVTIYDRLNEKFLTDQMCKVKLKDLSGTFAQFLGWKVSRSEHERIVKDIESKHSADWTRVEDKLLAEGVDPEEIEKLRESENKEAKREEIASLMNVKLTENERINQRLEN